MRVTKELLDDTNIHSLFEQMSCIGVPEAMDRSDFIDSSLENCVFKGPLYS